MKTKPVLFCAALLAAGGALIAGVVLYNLLLVPRGITWRFGWIGPLCYSAFYSLQNHATFKQIKKRHSINYSDGFYIGLLYAVPLVLS